MTDGDGLRRPENETDVLLRELNHRVKNNFQIIVSLMNLKKRLFPPERRDDIRFIEEHVQAMAVAYRLVYATGGMNEVSVGELLAEVVFDLGRIARITMENIHLVGASIPETMGLDQAICFGLFLAVLLPPYFDHAVSDSSQVAVAARISDNVLTLSVAGSRPDGLPLDLLRSRLSEAYADQLRAERIPSSDASGYAIRFPLDNRRSSVPGWFDPGS